MLYNYHIPWKVQETAIAPVFVVVVVVVVVFFSKLTFHVGNTFMTRGKSLQLPYANEANFGPNMVYSCKRPPSLDILGGRLKQQPLFKSATLALILHVQANFSSASGLHDLSNPSQRLVQPICAEKNDIS